MFKKDFVEVTNDDDLGTLEKKANKLYSKLLGWSTNSPNVKLAMKWKELH